MQALSHNEACETLYEVARKTERREAVPGLVKAAVAQMLVSGHRLDRRNPKHRELVWEAKRSPAQVEPTTAEFDDKAFSGVKFDEAYASLLAYGQAQYVPAQPQSPVPSLQALAARAPQQSAFPRPIEITYDGMAYTVTKRVLLHCPAKNLQDVIDPLGWQQLGPFFEQLHAVRRSKESGSWHGEIQEVFVIDWNWVLLDRFVVRLKVDYTETDDLIRCDYSLMYDKDDQLLCDDGIAELRRVPGLSGWCLYTGTKSLRFASPALNLFAPGVLFMGLEREGQGIEALALKRTAEVVAVASAGTGQYDSRSEPENPRSALRPRRSARR
jgi:hypothetical protein